MVVVATVVDVVTAFVDVVAAFVEVVAASVVVVTESVDDVEGACVVVVVDGAGVVEVVA